MKLLLIGFSILTLPVSSVPGQTINFNRDIRPLFSDRCFHCHGPNEHDRQADLRLDQAEGKGGAYQAIEPGSIDDSELWYRITSEDDDVMPPPDSNKKPLSDAEKDILKRWIEAGAVYADFWAFVPPQKPPLPKVDDPRWGRHAIDRLVYSRLKEEGLTPSARASRRTVIRRLSLDLTGLPPTRDEIRDFLSDTRVDAHERLVDRLLARPQYGEHMTRYWLDLVRFADTNGIHHDHYRDMTAYRDWVIRAFNENLPYDEFVKYQLAGDLYREPSRDQLIASGFNRLHLIIDRGTALPEESYTRNVVDRVTAVGTAFMGMTVGCAVCHDHKYDPMTMKDFYQLFAFFNNLDGAPETGGRSGSDFQRGLQPPYVSVPTKEQEAELADFDRRINEVTAKIREIEQRAKTAGDDNATKAFGAELKRAKEVIARVQAEKSSLQAAIPVAMVMKEKADPRPAFILIRGAYDKPGEQVKRDTPAFLPPMKETNALTTRMDLAEWFVSRENPLTARVAVNRFWQQVFGVGIVKTSEDFGAQGEWPSHPELLDYLAISFIESGWDVKALMKQIVMSETYQQTSKATPEQFEKDPENRLLARGSRYRLDAEVVRDQILATSGRLNYEMYGKSVKPPQPPGLWKAVSMPSSYPREYQADTGDLIYRRSLYTFWKRGMPPPQMTIMNAPTREACIARRERTNTPLEALLLMNEPEFLKAARYLAHQTIKDRSLNAADQLGVVYETITSKCLDATEADAFLKLVAELKEMYDDNPNLADELCDGVQLHEEVSKSELAAWTMLASSIYNLDITKTRD